MSVIVDVLGSFLFEVVMAPAERLAERLWRLHRKEPTWWRVISATVLGLLSLLIYLAWLAILIGIPVAIFVLAT